METIYSKQTAIPSIPLILVSGAELTEYYSVHSGIRIGPKRTQLPPNFRIVSKERALSLTNVLDAESFHLRAFWRSAPLPSRTFFGDYFHVTSLPLCWRTITKDSSLASVVSSYNMAATSLSFESLEIGNHSFQLSLFAS